MGASKHIERTLFEKNLSKKQLAEMLGKPPQTMWNQFNRNTWKFSEVEKIADLLGCDIVFKDRENGKEY